MIDNIDITLETAIALARLAGENEGSGLQHAVYDGEEEAMDRDELYEWARSQITKALPDVSDDVRAVLIPAYMEGYHNTVHAIP